MAILKINDEELYTLEVTFNSLCMVEELEGKSAELIFKEGNVGFRLMRTLLYAAIINHNPLLTMEGTGIVAGNYCKAHGFENFVKIIMSEYQKSGCLGSPDKDTDEENKKK
jgi:hypothetical protein